MKAMVRWLLVCAAMTVVRGQIAIPESGIVRDNDGSVRPLLGVAGGWRLGEALASEVLSAANSGRWSAWKTADRIEIRSREGVTREWEAGPGPALFAFHAAGTPRAAYLTEAGRLLVWRDVRRAPVEVDWQAAGKVAGLGADDEGNVVAFVERDGTVWRSVVDAASGIVSSELPLPGVAAPLMALSGGRLLYTAAEGLRLRQADGSELELEMTTAGRELEMAAADAVIVRGRDGGASALVRCDRAPLETLILPSGVAR